MKTPKLFISSFRYFQSTRSRQNLGKKSDCVEIMAIKILKLFHLRALFRKTNVTHSGDRQSFRQVPQVKNFYIPKCSNFCLKNNHGKCLWQTMVINSKLSLILKFNLWDMLKVVSQLKKPRKNFKNISPALPM